jgi:hypothetical protein
LLTRGSRRICCTPGREPLKPPAGSEYFGLNRRARINVAGPLGSLGSGGMRKKWRSSDALVPM